MQRIMREKRRLNQTITSIIHLPQGLVPNLRFLPTFTILLPPGPLLLSRELAHHYVAPITMASGCRPSRTRYVNVGGGFEEEIVGVPHERPGRERSFRVNTSSKELIVPREDALLEQ